MCSSRIREAVIAGWRSQVGNRMQAEKHCGPPLFDGESVTGVELLDMQENLRAGAHSSHGGNPRPGLQGLAGDQGAMQKDVMLAVDTATGLLPGFGRQVGVGGLLRLKRQDDRKDHGHRLTIQNGGDSSPVAAAYAGMRCGSRYS